jgi:protoporphyrin/coproporphyrin ferrochelatase
MTFGSAVTADDVPAYLTSVRGGRPVPADVLDEFRRRYQVIGRSPLVDITQAQARALQRRLDEEHGKGRFAVRAGMLHSQPRIATAVGELAALGVRSIVAIALAPQYSPVILAGYERAVAGLRDSHPDVDVHIAGAWHTLDEWIASLAERLDAAVQLLPGASRDSAPIIFTAHSLPRAVVDRDPGYIDQLRETAAAVAGRAGVAPERWSFAYQSAGHTPEPWLTPDVKDLLPALRDRGVRDVLVVPVQFLADHLEILYDLDVAARDEAASLGITMHRIAMPNDSEPLIRALAAVVRRETLSAKRAG